MTIGAINNYDRNNEINRQEEVPVINQAPGQDQSALAEEILRKAKELQEQINSAPNLEALAQLQDKINELKGLMNG